jgi:hypothetical protein
MGQPDPTLSLYRLLTPQVRADPYPLYERLRTEDPVHWDPFLHAWVVTRYADVVAVLHDVRFSAHRTPTPEHLTALGLGALSPIAQVMVRQMLFMDPPAHTRLRNLAAKAFTPRRVERLRPHIQDIVDDLLDRAARRAGPRFAPPPAGLPPAAHRAAVLRTGAARARAGGGGGRGLVGVVVAAEALDALTSSHGAGDVFARTWRGAAPSTLAAAGTSARRARCAAHSSTASGMLRATLGAISAMGEFNTLTSFYLSQSM